MQTSDRAGISCDNCLLEYREDFTYYSLDFKNVSTQNNSRPSIDTILRMKSTLGLDFCEACYDKISNVVKEIYDKSILSPKRTPRTDQICELTGTVMSGTYRYYYCEIAKAVVRTSTQPYMCSKCKNQTAEKVAACPKCQAAVFRPAVVRVGKRCLEIVLCEAAFKHFEDKLQIAKQQQKKTGQWSTTT